MVPYQSPWSRIREDVVANILQKKCKMLHFLHTRCLWKCNVTVNLLHSEWPKLHRVLAILCGLGLISSITSFQQPVPDVVQSLKAKDALIIKVYKLK